MGRNGGGKWVPDVVVVGGDAASVGVSEAPGRHKVPFGR